MEQERLPVDATERWAELYTGLVERVPRASRPPVDKEPLGRARQVCVCI